MSSARVQKILQGAAEQIKRLGQYAPKASDMLIWSGRDANGHDAAVISVDGATWASGSRQATIVAIPAGDALPAAFHTQSHALGQTLDGSVSFQVYMEAPAAMTDAQAAFIRHVEHHLRGQLSAPVEMKLAAHGTQATVNGVNGAVATAAATSAGVDLPALWPAPGGV